MAVSPANDWDPKVWAVIQEILQPKPKADILACFDPVKISTQHKLFKNVEGQET